MSNPFIRIILFPALSILMVSCHRGPDQQPKLPVRLYLQLPSDSSTSRIDLAYLAIEKEEDYHEADSILNQAIQAAISNMDREGQIRAYTDYFLIPGLPDYQAEQSNRHALKAMEWCAGMQPSAERWNLLRVLVDYFVRSQDPSSSLKLSTLMFDEWPGQSEPAVSALSYVALAKAQEANNEAKPALKNYLQAMYLAERSGSSLIKIQVYSEISDFYKRKLLYQKAYEFKKKELELDYPDSLSRFDAKLLLLDLIRLSNDEGQFDLESFFEILDFAKTHGYKKLKSFAMAFLRTSYFESGKTKELYLIFQNRLPDEFAEFKSNDPFGNSRLMALYHQSENQVDSAQFYFSSAIRILQNQNLHPGVLSRFYLRYGDFLHEQSRFEEAERAYRSSAEQADITMQLKFQISSTARLVELYQKTNNYKEAISQMNKLKALETRRDALLHDRDILGLEFEYEERIRQEEARQEAERLHRWNQSQYGLIAVFILGVFTLLIVATQYKVPLWLIRSLGFLAFILLFEYFIIRIDKVIHHLTQESPWKLFSIKVLLIAILYPLHHWIESKVVHQLIKRRSAPGSLFSFNFDFLKKWFNRLNREE